MNIMFTRLIITQHSHCIRSLTKYRTIPFTRHSAKHVKQSIQPNKKWHVHRPACWDHGMENAVTELYALY
jgi:hypothetical protein